MKLSDLPLITIERSNLLLAKNIMICEVMASVLWTIHVRTWFKCVDGVDEMNFDCLRKLAYDENL